MNFSPWKLEVKITIQPPKIKDNPYSALGAMYFKGEGVPKDLVMAYMWRNLAAAQGSEIAKKARDALESSMTPE